MFTPAFYTAIHGLFGLCRGPIVPVGSISENMALARSATYGPKIRREEQRRIWPRLNGWELLGGADSVLKLH